MAIRQGGTRVGSGQTTTVFLGENLLPLMVLAIGGGMFVGNFAAVVRPRAESREGELERAPVARSGLMAVVGAVAAVWAIASLL